MNNTITKTKKITYTSIVAAMYVTLTYILIQTSYLPIQFRLSEILTILPYFSSFPIVGLTTGCLLSNILSPYGILDMVFGTLATFIAASITHKIGKSNLKFKKLIAPLPAVIVNGIIIGILINLSLPKGSIFSSIVGISINLKALLPTMFTVALSEVVPCYLLGLPLLFLIEKNNTLSKLLK